MSKIKCTCSFRSQVQDYILYPLHYILLFFSIIIIIIIMCLYIYLTRVRSRIVYNTYMWIEKRGIKTKIKSNQIKLNKCVIYLETFRCLYLLLIKTPDLLLIRTFDFIPILYNRRILCSSCYHQGYQETFWALVPLVLWALSE